MAEWSKALVSSTSLFGVVGSNPTVDINSTPLAQLVERGSNKPNVTGSSPVWSIWYRVNQTLRSIMTNGTLNLI